MVLKNAARFQLFGNRSTKVWCNVVVLSVHAVRVEWGASIENTSSVRAPQKAGFTLEAVRRDGFHRRDGTRGDEWVGVRLRREG